MNKKEELVSVVSANYKNVNEKIKTLLELINYEPKRDKILIKPNIGPRKKDSPIITNPKLIEALILYFKDKAKEIVIGEGTVVGIPTDVSFEIAGYNKLAKKYDIKLLDFNKCERIPVKWKFGEIMIPKILKTHEYINVAKMKTHIQTTVTLAVKNQKGLLLPEDKKNFHKSEELEKKIMELSLVIKPDLNIIDAIDCIEGNGPGAEGRLVKLNILLASKDIMAIDNASLDIMGIPIDKVKYLIPKDFKILSNFSIKKHKFKLPNGYHKKLNLRLWFNDSCSGCNYNIVSAIKSLPKHPTKLAKFILNITLRKLNIVAGPRYKTILNKGKVICIGDCTKKIAKQNNYYCIEGCPPTVKEIIEKL